LPLEVVPDASVLPCRNCGTAYEVESDHLKEVRPRTASVTTELATPPGIRYLATWRFLAAVEVRSSPVPGDSVGSSSVWENIRRVAAPDPPFLYVPAFALQRVVVQQLGVALVQAQPGLELTAGLPPERPSQLQPVSESSLRERHDWQPDAGFGTLSPILLSSDDAEKVAHFVYLALEARSSPDLREIDYELALSGGELLFLPAVYDVRHVRDSNWRFLLREFDGLVA
jgi:hypothetical protein